jgi:tetratricopeptide (TPR) repeat protein
VFLVAAASLLAACHRDPEQVKQQRLKTAQQYLDQHKYREAIVELRGAVQAVPSYGPAHLQLAGAYVATGNGPSALREFVTAADLMPDAAEAQLKAGRMLLLAGQFDSARDRAQKVLAKDDHNVDALVLAGNAMAALKDLDGAITEVETAIASDPDRSLSYSNLGMMHMAKGDRDQAEAAFTHAVEIDPKSMGATLALANFYWSAGRMDDAERTLKQAATLDPNSLIVHRALATFYMSTNRPAEAEPHLKAAAEASTAVGPKLVLADYYRRMGRQDDAMTWLTSIAKQPDGFVAASTRIASLQYASGSTADAEKTIDAVLARSPRDPDAHIVKAMLLTSEHRLDEALTHATAAVTSAPQLVRGHMVVGSIDALLNKPDAAIQSFQDALKLSPASVDAEIALARLYAARGDWAMTRQYAQSALKGAPGNGDVHVLLARAQTESGALGDAKKELDTLKGQAASGPSVQYALGRRTPRPFAATRTTRPPSPAWSISTSPKASPRRPGRASTKSCRPIRGRRSSRSSPPAPTRSAATCRARNARSATPSPPIRRISTPTRRSRACCSPSTALTMRCTNLKRSQPASRSRCRRTRWPAFSSSRKAAWPTPGRTTSRRSPRIRAPPWPPTTSRG